MRVRIGIALLVVGALAWLIALFMVIATNSQLEAVVIAGAGSLMFVFGGVTYTDR